MAQYILKSDLVAWAKETYLCENASMIRKVCYKQLLEHLDTIEVKEVQEEPVSEDLEKELSAYVNSKEYTNSIGTSGLLLIARHFADWQKNKMMEDAMDGIIAESAGGDGWVNVMTGFVKSKDVNVKLGDKIKIIIIKED